MANDDEDDDTSGGFGVGKYPCMPSLVALQQMKNRLHLAHVGKKLMKWTTVATGKELRKTAMSLQESYVDFPEATTRGYILLARARYFYPNLHMMVIQNLEPKATVTVSQTHKSITGVKLIGYDINESQKEPYIHLGIDKGGQTIREVKKHWRDLLRKLVWIVELREYFMTIDKENKGATKKMNVLAKIVIPRTKTSIGYILAELEESAREEFFRIKKIMAIKERDRRKKLKLSQQISKPKPTVEIIETPIEVLITEEPPEEPPEEPIERKLCVLCSKLLTNDEEVKPRRKSRQDDGKLQEYKFQLQDLLEKTRDVDENKMISGSIKEFLSATENLIEKLEKTPNDVLQPIPSNLDPDELCISCRKRRKSENVQFQESDLSDEFFKEDLFDESLEQIIEELPEQQLRPEVDLELGVFETEIEETIQVIRKRNEDGTITEERKVTKIQKKARRPT